MARSAGQSASPPSISKSNPDATENSVKQEQQLLPPNLRLNDDILSVHFNNVTSNVKKRHSLSDPADSLIKYLSSNVTTNTNSSAIIQVRDESLNPNANDSKLTAVPTMVAYENLLDIQSNLQQRNEEEQSVQATQVQIIQQEQQVLIETIGSDSDSDAEHSDGIESAVSTPTTITTTVIASIQNLKSLLKTPVTPKNLTRRVTFDPLALLLDAAVVGELDLVVKAAKQVCSFT